MGLNSADGIYNVRGEETQIVILSDDDEQMVEDQNVRRENEREAMNEEQ